MNRQMPLWIALSLVLGAGTADGQCTPGSAGKNGPGPGMPAFADFDLDGDGVIDSEEYYQARAARMAERAQAGGKMMHAADMPTFEDIDTDGDGSLSQAEFAAHHAHHRMPPGKGKNR
jgi:hypothetical protein